MRRAGLLGEAWKAGPSNGPSVARRERLRHALTARAGSGVRTAQLARRANAMDGVSKRMSREAERPKQDAKGWPTAPVQPGEGSRALQAAEMGTAQLARRANAMDGVSKRMSREAERPKQDAKGWPIAPVHPGERSRALRAA